MWALNCTATETKDLMAPAFALPRRPTHLSAGDEMPMGTYYVQPIEGGYTVQRTIGMHRWFPLTSLKDPTWITWPSYEAAHAWMDKQGEKLSKFPFWGR